MGFSLGDQLTNAAMNQESARFVEACVNAGSAQDFKLVQMGFSPPLAIEIARQINAGLGRADYLINLGMPFPQARVLAEGVGGNWYDSAAVLDADFTSGRFRWNGVTYTDETTFLAAIGGSKSSSQRTIGPYVDPAATELILNGTFTTDLTSWTTVLNGTSSASVVSAAARLVSDGTTGTGAGGAGISQGFSTILNKAYRALYDVLVGTSGARIGGSTASGAGIVGGTKSVANGNVAAWSARSTTSYFYGYRNGAGSGGFDNISVKECLPFKNFTLGGFSARIRGVTPAAAAGNKVAVSFDIFEPAAGATIDTCELVYNASGELHVQVTFNGASQGDINLGAVTVSTAFDVLLTLKAGELPRARLATGLPLPGSGSNVSGVAALFVGRHNQTGNTWDGGDPRVQVYAGGGAEQFYGLIDNTIHFDGDSFAGGAHSVVLPSTLQTLMSRAVYNTGVGGDTMDSISARLVAASPAIKSKVAVVWDGDNNGMTTVSAYADLLAAGLAGVSHFIVIPTCVNRGQADVSVEAAIRDEFVTRWGARVIDWRNVLTMNGSVPADTMYFITDGSDDTHLSQAAMDLMSTAIKNLIASNAC